MTGIKHYELPLGWEFEPLRTECPRCHKINMPPINPQQDKSALLQKLNRLRRLLSAPVHRQMYPPKVKLCASCLDANGLELQRLFKPTFQKRFKEIHAVSPFAGVNRPVRLALCRRTGRNIRQIRRQNHA